MKQTKINYGSWADEYLRDAEKMTELINRLRTAIKSGDLIEDHEAEYRLRTYREIRLELVRTADKLRRKGLEAA